MPLDGNLNMGGTGFTQGFVNTSIQLARLGLVRRRQAALIASEKERQKLERQRLAGLEATQKLKDAAFRQQLQQIKQRQEMATAFLAPQGPTREAAAALTPERMLAAQAIREGQIGTAANILTPSPTARPPTTVAAAMLAQGVPPEDVLRTIEQEKAKFRRGIRISQDAEGNPVIELGGGVSGLPTSEVTRLNKVTMQTRRTTRVIDRLETLVAQDPQAFGAAADLSLTVASAVREGRRVFATLARAGTDISTQFIPTGDAAEQLLRNISTQNISRAQFLTELLVSVVALQQNPDGRINNADVRRARRTIGGTIKNIEDLLPRLAELRQSAQNEFSEAQQILEQSGVFVAPLGGSRGSSGQDRESSQRLRPIDTMTPAEQEAEIQRRLEGR